jgi:C-terminal domain of 1-Cys peroxiredoxin
MIQIGQKIDFIDELEFDAYQNNEIKKKSFPTMRGSGWYIHDNSICSSAEEILRKLQAASFVSQHQGEVCPASWKPGKKTLKPG